VLPVRPIGTLMRRDGDHKVVAVRVDLPSAYTATKSASEIPGLESTISRFFRSPAAVDGWLNAADTRRLILEGQRAWAKRQEAS